MDSDIGIPEGLGPFYLPEGGDVAYVSDSVFDGAQVESVFLDDEGDIQAFSEGDQGGVADPRLVHYSHISQRNAHLAKLPQAAAGALGGVGRREKPMAGDAGIAVAGQIGVT
ncbi:hypothetical protein [Kitasatospora aburaviensis]|uniref:Uncharacterized protein n=2 Tax=Kitasatospora TaxID=2063 RepID=A0ABW1FCB6_9ACTN